MIGSVQEWESSKRKAPTRQAVDNKAGTALHRAAGTGALETCRVLLESRCFDVNQAENC